jgi:hypothetical protein
MHSVQDTGEIWLFLRTSGILRRSVINRRLWVEWYRPFSFAEDCLCSLWVNQELTDVDNSEVEDCEIRGELPSFVEQHPTSLLNISHSFDFDQHIWRNKPAHLDHGSRRSNTAEDFSVCSADLLPFIDIGDINASANDIL